MHSVFPAIAAGRVHRWGGVTLVVARRETLDRAPSWSPLPLPAPAGRRLSATLPLWRHAEWAAGRLLARSLGQVPGWTSVCSVPRDLVPVSA